MPTSQDSHLNLFDDDIILYATSISINHATTKLQNRIEKIIPWLQDWKVSLNVNKYPQQSNSAKPLKNVTESKSII